ncbi:phosphatase PAP2 family protein [Sporosarcina pasteurii]|uniref:Undecaprenyl-diphosphatase ybjG n=1 Tax=Sporosarcina pasteurii TaxID=1474 RepID=A0A380CLG3_SPOPA|nr:phosphatase PAP2 family protein [Sporosarcina pasteurii]MDS9471920.1 phosphatase PAP2 family protein [Sporosarcina pasteurii]SUJ21943.1 Putative undecaprenyl-diphosphatase ybjG [Sporosarcina pasteurii]
MKGLSKNILIVLVIIVVSGSLFITMANLVGSGKIESFDLPIIRLVQGLEAPWLTVLFKTFTWIGSAKAVVPITIIVCFLLFFVYKHRQQAFVFAFSIVGTIALNELLKGHFKRARPEIYRIMDAGGYSFPSGHTMMAFSLYGMITYILWRNIKTVGGRVALLSFASFMAFMIATSRIYLGVHYPSDVVGGIAASTICVTISAIIYSACQHPRKNNETEST